MLRILILFSKFSQNREVRVLTPMGENIQARRKFSDDFSPPKIDGGEQY